MIINTNEQTPVLIGLETMGKVTYYNPHCLQYYKTFNINIFRLCTCLSIKESKIQMLPKKIK